MRLEEISRPLVKWFTRWGSMSTGAGFSKDEIGPETFVEKLENNEDTAHISLTLRSQVFKQETLPKVPVQITELDTFDLSSLVVVEYTNFPTKMKRFAIYYSKAAGLADYLRSVSADTITVVDTFMPMHDVIELVDSHPSFAYKVNGNDGRVIFTVERSSAIRDNGLMVEYKNDMHDFEDVFDMQEYLISGKFAKYFS